MGMEVFGWAAGALSVVHNIPQIFHLVRRKSGKDISMVSQCTRTLSYVLYVVHSAWNGDMPLLYACIAGLIQCIIIVCLVIYYDVYCKKSSPKDEVHKLRGEPNVLRE